MILKTLVVDDDKRLRSVLKGLLSEEGHQVTTCKNGSEAIATCLAEKFDLIITDLKMPGADGLDVLRKAKKKHPDILVIIVTGFASLETAIQAIREGAYDYITKPFKLEEFKILIKNASEKVELIKENQSLLVELQEAYRHLNIAKKIMGLNSDSEGVEKTPSSDPEDRDLFIAGSMLSQVYLEKKGKASFPVLSDLERISSLKDKGFLSDEEFELCKSKLMKKIQS
jgi:DNA-binding NtrC family response regulator